MIFWCTKADKGTNSNLTVQKLPFQLSSKVEQPALPPSFLNGSSQARIILSHMRKKKQEKLNSQLWFRPEWAAIIAHCNHCYNLDHKEWCSGTLAAFQTACNHCKRILENKTWLFWVWENLEYNSQCRQNVSVNYHYWLQIYYIIIQQGKTASMLSSLQAKGHSLPNFGFSLRKLGLCFIIQNSLQVIQILPLSCYNLILVEWHDHSNTSLQMNLAFVLSKLWSWSQYGFQLSRNKFCFEAGENTCYRRDWPMSMWLSQASGLSIITMVQ